MYIYSIFIIFIVFIYIYCLFVYFVFKSININKLRRNNDCLFCLPLFTGPVFLWFGGGAKGWESNFYVIYFIGLDKFSYICKRKCASFLAGVKKVRLFLDWKRGKLVKMVKMGKMGKDLDFACICHFKQIKGKPNGFKFWSMLVEY